MLTSYELEDLKFLIFGLRVIAPVIVSVKWPTVAPTNPNQAWFQFSLRLFVSWTGPQICPDHHQYCTFMIFAEAPQTRGVFILLVFYIKMQTWNERSWRSKLPMQGGRRYSYIWDSRAEVAGRRLAVQQTAFLCDHNLMTTCYWALSKTLSYLGLRPR